MASPVVELIGALKKGKSKERKNKGVEDEDG